MTGGHESTADVSVAESRADPTHGGHCLNCGTALIGPHCHSCGQSAHIHRSARAIGHEIAHGVFHFEGKIWRTLPLLAFRPGELTRRYVAGERAKFVSPLAIFLFSVFLMFAIVANLPGSTLGGEELLKAGGPASIEEARTRVAQDRGRQQAELSGLQRSLAQERARATPDAQRITSLSERINRTSGSIRDLTRLETTLSASARPDTAEPGESWFEAKVRHARENPDLVLYKLKTSAYKYSWVLIPLSIPILWLLFPFSRRFALYDHAIFVTYSLSFMSLLTIVLAVLSALGVGTGVIVAAGTVIPVVHIYKQLKGAYALRRAGALARTIILVSLILWLVAPAFAIGVLYMGVG